MGTAFIVMRRGFMGAAMRAFMTGSSSGARSTAKVENTGFAKEIAGSSR